MASAALVTAPLRAAGVEAVMVPPGEPQKAGGGQAVSSRVGAASGTAAGTPLALGPHTPGNPTTTAWNQADKQALAIQSWHCQTATVGMVRIPRLE